MRGAENFQILEVFGAQLACSRCSSDVTPAVHDVLRRDTGVFAMPHAVTPACSRGGEAGGAGPAGLIAPSGAAAAWLVIPPGAAR